MAFMSVCGAGEFAVSEATVDVQSPNESMLSPVRFDGSQCVMRYGVCVCVCARVTRWVVALVMVLIIEWP